MIYLFGKAEKFRYENSFKYYLNDRFGTNNLIIIPVYQLLPSHLVRDDELTMLTELLNANNQPLPENGFYLKPVPGQMTPWGLKFTQMMHDLRFQTLSQIDRYFYCYIEGKRIDYETQRILTSMFLPEVYMRESKLTVTHELENREKHLDWLYVKDIKEERIQRILNRYGLANLNGIDENAFERVYARHRKILPLSLLAFSALPIKHINMQLQNINFQERTDAVIRTCNRHYQFVRRKATVFLGSVSGKKSVGLCMKHAAYSLFEETCGGSVDDFSIVFPEHKPKYATWSHYSHLSGTPVQLIQFCQQATKPRVYAFGAKFHKGEQPDYEGASLVLIGSPKMSRLAMLGDDIARQDDLRVEDSNYLNPELMRRFQAIFFRANQIEGQALIGVINLTLSGLMPKMLSWASEWDVGFRMDIQTIPRFHHNIRDEDLLYQPWNDALVLIIDKRYIDQMIDVFDREVCPYRTIGVVTKDPRVVIHHAHQEQPYIDCLVSDVTDYGFSEINDDNVNYEVASSEEKEVPDSISNQLLEWLYRADFADMSLFLERLDTSCHGRSIQGMQIGKWQVPVNQCTIISSGKVWYAKALAVQDDFKGTDIRLIIRAIWYRLLQHVDEFSKTHVHLIIPHNVYDEKMLSEFRESLKSNITWEVTNAYEPLQGIGYGQAIQERPRMSPSMLYSEGKHLIHVTPSLNHQGFISLYQLISSAMHDGKVKGFVSADMGIWPGLLRVLFSSRLGFEVSDTQAGVEGWVKGAEGVIVQVVDGDVEGFISSCLDVGLSAYALGQLRQDDKIIMNLDGIDIEFKRQHLQKIWAKDWLTSLTHKARENDEYFSSDQFLSQEFPGLNHQYLPTHMVKYDRQDNEPIVIAIIRDRGTFGHFNVAKALMSLDITCIDITFTDLIEKRETLRSFQGVIFPGGATYGDEGNAGLCTALKILKHECLRREFEQFFLRPDTLTLGFGNGGQILAHLQEIIPGANWEIPTRNKEDKYVSRYVPMLVENSPSIVMRELRGCQLLASMGLRYGYLKKIKDQSQIVMRVRNPIVDSPNSIVNNPTDCDRGAVAFTTDDGRVTWFLGHPERHVFLNHYDLYQPSWLESHSPWMQIFHSMANWIDKKRSD